MKELVFLDNSSREETQDDADDEEETMKKYFRKSPFCNGDIRSSSTKRSNSHRHVPQIVLIPQQSHPFSSSSSEIPFNYSSHYNLFNSNMYLLEKHLKRLINKQKYEEDRNEIINEWKLMALIMDRLLFWLFAALTILSTVLCLIIIPFLKNAGYIQALAKDLIMDYQSITNIIEQQIKNNFTGRTGQEK